jgi:hypothetical protein
MLADAGFTNITFHWQNWPFGTWAKGEKNKKIGRWWAEDIKEACRNSNAMFTRVLGWKQEEFDVLVAKVVNEVDAQKKHVWAEM